MTTQPSDWAVAQAFRELDDCGKHTSAECAVFNAIFNRARELDASGDGVEPVASVCLVTDRRLPHFAAAEVQLFNGYEPKIGDKLYTTPQPSADAVRELVQRWRISASVCGESEYSDGARDAFSQCADELESLLGRGGK